MNDYDFLTDALKYFPKETVLAGFHFNGKNAVLPSSKNKAKIQTKNCLEFLSLVKKNASPSSVIHLHSFDPRDSDSYIYLEVFPSLNSFTIHSEY